MLKKTIYNIFLVVALSVLLVNLCQVQADLSQYPLYSDEDLLAIKLHNNMRNIEKNKHIALRLGMPFRIYKSTHASEISTASTTTTRETTTTAKETTTTTAKETTTTTAKETTTTEKPKVKAYQYSIDSINDELSKIMWINFIRTIQSGLYHAKYRLYNTKRTTTKKSETTTSSTNKITTTTEKPKVYLHEALYAYPRFGRK